jgi:glycosyltransferase involved in cell wall biosynthesis
MLGTIWSRRRDYAIAQVDVYSGAAFVWAESAAALLRRMGKPHVLTLHGGNLPAFAARWPGRVARLLRGAGAVTSPSRYLARSLERFRGDIRVIPNPLDTELYPFRPRTALVPRLVWVRAFHRMYNPALALSALLEVRRRHPDATLTMIGPDKGDGSLAEVRSECSRLGLAECVSLPGAVSKREIPARLSCGDVFLNTTDVDNAPVSVLEAMACGLCVVSTDAGGMPDLAVNDENALLVPRRDASAMAAAVARLLGNSDLAARISRNARTRALECDVARVLEGWREVFSEMAGTANGRAGP